MDKTFSRDDFMMKVLPGGFLLGFFTLFGLIDIKFKIPEHYDVLLSFIFVCFSFVTGEILQILSHTKLFEFLAIKSGLKNRLPSEIFLYKDNPIISNNYREELLKRLKILKTMPIDLEYSYGNVPYNRDKTHNYNIFSQEIFRKIYTPLKNTETIKRTNIYYLFLRCFLLESLFINIFLLYQGYFAFCLLGLFVSLVISMRLYSVSKKLIYFTVIETLYSKNKVDE